MTSIGIDVSEPSEQVSSSIASDPILSTVTASVTNDASVESSKALLNEERAPSSDSFVEHGSSVVDITECIKGTRSVEDAEVDKAAAGSRLARVPVASSFEIQLQDIKPKSLSLASQKAGFSSVDEMMEANGWDQESVIALAFITGPMENKRKEWFDSDDES